MNYKSDGCMKIYLIDTKDLDIERALKCSLFTKEDIDRINRFTFEQSKKEKIVSTYFIKKYIGEYYLNEHGKPLSNKYFFNVSHSKGMVAFVMDDVPIGIDIELKREITKELIEYISSPSELEYIKNEQNFFEIWTNKESLVKADGTGLTGSIKDIPGLPINNIKKYKKDIYRSKTIVENDLVITVCRKDTNDFEIELIKDNFKYE